MNNKVLIIYHDADFDGILSNKVCRYFLTLLYSQIDSIGWDYGKSTPSIEGYDQVYMVDISIDQLMATPGLIWLDHHASAIEKFDNSILGYRIDGVAACRLCWQWFLHNRERADSLPDKGMYIERLVIEPLLIRLVGEHDIWDHRDERALILQSGLRELNQDEFNELVLHQFEGNFNAGELLDNCLTIGKRSKSSRDRANATTIKKIGHDVHFHGLTFLCCNGLSGSQAFEAGILPHHDALMGWRFDGQTKKCTVSLYHAPGKEHHDLSLIAKEEGGGGHKGACGFQITLDNWDFIINPLN